VAIDMMGFSFEHFYAEQRDRKPSMVSYITNTDGRNPSSVIAAVRRGLPMRAYALLKDSLHKHDAEMGMLLNIQPRTLSRRKKEARLSPAESDRVVRLARITDAAVSLFDDEQEAIAWLDRPLAILNEESPLQRASTDIGAREVENLIGRIEHGVFS